MSSKSSAVAIRGKSKANGHSHPASEPEKLPEPENLFVPAALMLAAEATSAPSSDKRQYLCSVYLHSRDGKARIASTDGTRLFLASFPIVGAEPAWLKDGLLLATDRLRGQVAMIAKSEESSQVCVRYAKGLPKAELTDEKRDMVFQAALQAGEFPDYERVLPVETFQNLDPDGNPVGKEWEPVGINSRYLKQVGDVAKMLDAGLVKEARNKDGMVVRAYNSGDPKEPLVFDFLGWPGVILVMMPARLSDASTSRETAALLAPAIRMTIAALRAHETRNIGWAEEATDETAKAGYLAKAEGFQQRIVEILKRVPGFTAIEAPTSPTQPDPESEAANAEQDAADAVRASGDPEGEPEGHGEQMDDPTEQQIAAE